MKNLTDFMIDAAKNADLGKEFISKLHEGDDATLSAWLKKKGYKVTKSDCKKLHKNKEHMKKENVGFAY